MSFKITPSYQSYVIAFITLFLFLAATNVQGGWLYIIDSLLVSLLLFSLISPISQIKKLNITRVFNKSIYEGEKLEIEIVINNKSNRNASFLEIADTRIKRKNDKSTNLMPEEKAKFFVELNSKEIATFKYNIKPELRGVYLFEKFIISSYGAFGLFKFSKTINIHDELVVLPNLTNLNSLFFSAIKGAGYKYSSKSRNNLDATLPYNVREYRRGDNRKLVHWRSTARHNKLMVKELESEQSLSIQIILDTQKGMNTGLGKESSFEYFIKFAGSILKLCIEKSHRADFIYYQDEKINILTDDTPIRQILDNLAHINNDSKIKVRELIKEKEIDFNSVIIPFFLNPDEKDIELLSEMYRNNYSVMPIFAEINSFDKNHFPIKDIIAKCPFKYITIKQGEKLTGI